MTIISSNVYNKIPLNKRPPLKTVPSTVKLEVANDGLLSALGEMSLEFKIQKDICRWDVFVAPIREDELLGLDFLQAYNYVLGAEFGLKLNKKKYKTVIQKVPLRAIRIRCKETVVIPACSEVIVPGECVDRVAKPKQGMVTPIPNNENRDYIIVDPNRSDIGIPVQILNPTSSDIILNSKTVIGVMQEVDEEKPFNYVSTVNDTCQNKSVNKEQNVPEHLQDLFFKRSCKSLSPEQSQELKQLLIKHQNVFAKSSNDLGRTSVVKHEIHVGENAKPIKQRPRRAPVALIREDGLLGLDFLQAYNYVLGAEFGLKLNKKKYKTVIQKVPLRAIRIRCKETVVLPACSEVTVPGECVDRVAKPK